MADNTHPEHPLSRIKLRVYKRSLLAGSMIIFGVMIVSIPGGTLYAWEHGVLSLIFAWTIYSFLRFRQIGSWFISTFEQTSYFLLLLYFLTHFLYETWQHFYSPIIDLRKFFLWLPIIYVIAFIIFQTKKAIRYSLAFMAALASIGTVILVMQIDLPQFWKNAMLLIQIIGSGAIYTILLNYLAHVKDGYKFAQASAETMTVLASVDPLLNIYNRRKMVDLLELNLASTNVTGRSFSVILFDIDNFKKINDQFGHLTGDEVLKHVIATIITHKRDRDHLGRWGGDEFIILCPDTDLDSAQHICQRLEKVLTHESMPPVGRVTISLGAATYTTEDTAKSIINRADQAMYIHKKAKP